ATVMTPGRAGRDGASHRVHALAPWVLLTAPWVKGDSPARFLADLEKRGEGLTRPGLAEALAGEAHRAAIELCGELDLAPLDGVPVLLAGDSIPRGMRCLPRGRQPLLAPLLAEGERLGVHLAEKTLAVDLLACDSRVVGVFAIERASGVLRHVPAEAVVLACGGVGAVFPTTTSPRWCRGSGLALAAWAGALLHHPHLTQALPVTSTPPLYFPTSAALLAGYIRVAGAPLAPLADLEAATAAVARALQEGKAVTLDPTPGFEPMLPARVRESPAFRRNGQVPLAVAVHHGIGGVAIDAWGRTSLAGLYACGEAAGGVQGARRTMGTGLLEARIFARRVAHAVGRDARRLGAAPPPSACPGPPMPQAPEELERRLDELLAPLAVVRPEAEVAATLLELEAWPMFSVGAAVEEISCRAALRLAAALAILRSCAAGSARGRASERREDGN
ncbi:MAG: FAD-binding protein, partial [Acidobacteriota bacterium]